MNASKQFIDVIAILKQHSQLNTAETRFQDFRDYKFVPRTPQRLISNSERQSHSLLVFLAGIVFSRINFIFVRSSQSAFTGEEYV
jgi:hypothetical protein